jgi:uncharacterized protein YbbC (DUF1343 family)/CubicO group peptidase (beta-lactamase class C family)
MAVATAAFAQEFAGSALLDQVIQDAIRQNQIPGAVLIVGHEGKIVHRKAYGNRVLVPKAEAMTVDTIFDCASLTKVIATTSSLMRLFDQGKFRLNDRVTQYIPQFQGGKSDITIRNLMTHFSGFRGDLTLSPPWSGYTTGIHLAEIDRPTGPPGARFVYSDINFILLGELVRQLGQEPLDVYARQHVFLPLGMKESMFNPPHELEPRIAPTERDGRSGAPLRGIVHDQTARFMGGVAGHAGLFSTADDLAKFAEMMLNGGQLDGVRLFSPLTVQKFTTPETPPDQPILRGLGWDIDSPFSANRGELFPLGSYGHTGFTGTSVWIDPVTNSYVILLTNSVHPFRRPPITALRSNVATIAAAALGVSAPGVSLTGYNETLSGAGIHRDVGRTAQVQTGIDVLVGNGFAPLKGKRVGLITNHTGLDRHGKRTVDLMKGGGIPVAALFSPEHGFAGVEDREGLADSVDSATGIRIFSLYGATRRPTPEMLRGVDALVFDIQDVGARFYTYTATMAYAMEAAATAGIPLYVLDRPNPITGVHVEGPLLDANKLSFIGYFPMPLRHGMTMGEMAKMFNAENHIGADLHVIEMKDWQRGDWFDSTGFPWTNPSPNMRSLNAALLYPGIGMLEYAKNYSVGRGTDAPFEQIGAEFINGPELAAYLNRRMVPGVRVYPTRFTPTESTLKGKTVHGIRFVITQREAFDATRLGLELCAALQKLYPGKIDIAANAKLIGSDEVIRQILAGDDPRLIQEKMVEALEPFLKMRQRYLLYR